MAKTPFPAYHIYMVIKVTELNSHTTTKCQWATDGFCQLCEPWQTLPQDHLKGLVHGTLLPSAVTRTLPTILHTNAPVHTNESSRVNTKTKDQALILKLGKSTSQEINPNCRPKVPDAFGNWQIETIVSSLRGHGIRML